MKKIMHISSPTNCLDVFGFDLFMARRLVEDTYSSFKKVFLQIPFELLNIFERILQGCMGLSHPTIEIVWIGVAPALQACQNT